MTHTMEKSSIDTFRQLAVTQGLTLGGLEHGGRHAQFIVATAAAALAFTPGRAYSESEVNSLLREWLACPGSMLSTDHVELRRCLVDCRLLERDGFGRRYARTAGAAEWSRALTELAGFDLAVEAQMARAANALRRAERKAHWEHRIRDSAIHS